jgi:hypothetical protein
MLRGHIDAAAGGAFLSLTIDGATTLIDKMVANQGWSEERSQNKQEGMYTVKETDVLATKMELLLKRLDERAAEKEAIYGTIKAMDSHMTCDVCGDVGHLGNDCPKTCGDTTYINNGFHQQGGNNGWNNLSCPQCQGGNSNFDLNYNLNQPSLKDLVLGQAKINENLTKKLMINDKMLENINPKLEGLTSFVKNQLSFNKMIETRLAQIAATIPIFDSKKILGQPKTSLESIKMDSTRFSKPLCQENDKYHANPPFVAKKEDPGHPTITCSIDPHVFHNAFFNLGVSINIMSKVT